MTQGLNVRLPTSDLGFNEAQYLSANPDVAQMVQQGLYPSGRAHYEEVGRLEGRSPLTGGNEGQTLAGGIQRWRQAVNNGEGVSQPTTPTTPPAGLGTPPTANVFLPADSQTPGSGQGGSGAAGGGDGRATSGSAANGAVGQSGLSLGRMGSIAGSVIGAIAGVPGLGLGLGALGNYRDVASMNDENAARDAARGIAAEKNSLQPSFVDALANMATLGLAGRSTATQARENNLNNSVAMIDAREAEYAADQAANAERDANNAAATAATAANPGAEDSRAEADKAAQDAHDSFGGYDGGYGAGSSSASDPGDLARGGRARRRFASGGLNNINPWDRVNADVDQRGLTSWTAAAEDQSPTRYRTGGLNRGHIQPSVNPIHAALGTHVRGPGTGRSDEVPAVLSNDEFVIPADVVAAKGDGSSNAGAKWFHDLVVTTRQKYRKKLGSLPPPKS